jgi:hypothetical protein
MWQNDLHRIVSIKQAEEEEEEEEGTWDMRPPLR